MKSGLAGGLTAGVQTWTGSLVQQEVLPASAKWVIDRLAAGAAGPLTGTGFGQALAGSLAHSAAATGAGAIGDGAFGPPGSAGHTLAHGALAALVARARGEDAAAAALGAMSEALLTPTVAGALGPDTDPRLLGTAVRLIGALTAEAAGRDGVAAVAAAGNAFDNNYLTQQQRQERDRRLAQCRTDTQCEAIRAEFDALDRTQDARAVYFIHVARTCDSPAQCAFAQSALETIHAGITDARAAGVVRPEVESWLNKSGAALQEAERKLLAASCEASATCRGATTLAGLALGAGAIGGTVKLAQYCLANPATCSAVGVEALEAVNGLVNAGRISAAGATAAAARALEQLAREAQPRRLAELVRLFDKADDANELRLGARVYTATVESNPGGTAKVFDTAALSDARLQQEVFDYATQLAGGRSLQPTSKPGVFFTTLDDGTTINVRSLSSSRLPDGNQPRWTVDVKGIEQVEQAANKKSGTTFELKFK